MVHDEEEVYGRPATPLVCTSIRLHRFLVFSLRRTWCVCAVRRVGGRKCSFNTYVH